MADMSSSSVLRDHFVNTMGRLYTMLEFDKQWVEVLREAVITTIVTKKQIKNHMGKKSFRALRQFQQACDKIDVMNAERAAVELGMKAEVIAGLKVLLER